MSTPTDDYLKLRTTEPRRRPGESDQEFADRRLLILMNLGQADGDEVSRAVCLAQVRELLA